MAMLALVRQNNNVKHHRMIIELGEEERVFAKEKFNKYKADNIIYGKYEDNIWIINDEKSTIKLDFTVNEVYIKKYLTYYTVEEFKNVLKDYMSLCFGLYIIGTLQELLYHIKDLMYCSECLQKMPSKRILLLKTGIQDFIELMPFTNEDIVLEGMRNKYEHAKRRDLAEYQSYFLFGKILEDYWYNKATDKEKIYYYPIYLWWNISMILPLRVTEFTLIPKNCLDLRNGIWYLKIRRTNVKGSAKKVVNYKIDDDFKIYEYAVTDDIVKMIKKYLEMTQDYKVSNIDSMFVDEPYISFTSTDYGYFHVNHFSWLMDRFLINIIENTYQYNIISKEDIYKTDATGEVYKLQANEIVRITLGDSRHIAMQSLLLNGCNILMAKEITGHDSTSTIFHYTGNMKNLIKCRAYSLFELSKRKEVAVQSIMGNNSVLSILGHNELALFVEVDDGKCFSQKFACGDMNDCYYVAGNCDICKYFKGNKGRLDAIQKQEKEIKLKIERLKEWITCEKEFRDKDEFVALSSQLKTCVDNLQNLYIEELKEETGNDK